MAIEQDRKDKIDDTPAVVLLQGEQRTIQCGTQPAPLVGIDVGIREPRQKRLRLLRQVLGGYSGLAQALVVLDGPEYAECAGRQAAILRRFDRVFLFLARAAS